MVHSQIENRTSLLNALDGHYSHVNVKKSLKGLDFRTAGQQPAGSPHSIFQILNHMIFWQGFFLQRLAGKSVPEPSEDLWPWPAQPDEHGWKETCMRFLADLDKARSHAERDVDLSISIPLSPETSRYEVLRIIASHNSYHVGQIVLLRKMLGAWEK